MSRNLELKLPPADSLFTTQEERDDRKREKIMDIPLAEGMSGIPLRRDVTSNNWGQFIRRLGMPHLRFHDLRHSAATNIHQLTGDFYTIGMILGHSLK